jgi:RNA polymerase sigma factor (sigma-70 family)
MPGSRNRESGSFFARIARNPKLSAKSNVANDCSKLDGRQASFDWSMRGSIWLKWVRQPSSDLEFLWNRFVLCPISQSAATDEQVKTISDQQLLRAYAERRSEAAFAELVRRHIDLVHSAAFRMLNDLHLAKDVTQGVFVALAKDAGKLMDHPVLSGWLHRTARNIAAQIIRTETRRRTRERKASTMYESPETDASWKEIAPHLDAALADLSEADRDALLLRYYENKSANHMAAILGISAEAAQKRVSRAVGRLRENFAKRGITAGVAGLVGVISANAVQVAPAGLAAIISTTVCAGPVSVLTKLLTMTTIQKALAAAAVVALVSGAAFYRYQGLPNTLESGAASFEPDVSSDRATSRRTEALTEQLARMKNAKTSVDRKKELERLKLRWIETGGGNDKLPEQDALAKESAELLMCSTEMIELLKFLTSNEFGYAESAIDSEVKALFGTSRAAEARQLLTELPETAEVVGERRYKELGKPYRDHWSKAAGRTCPEDQFESFRTALNCKSCAVEALYGRNQMLMGSDPEAAFKSSLDALKSGTPSISGRHGVMELFEGELPVGIDFAKLEQQLPTDWPNEEADRASGEEDAMTAIRGKLFWSWAKIAPVAAANHVLANPDRLAPGLMEDIVGGYSSYRHDNDIIVWVSTFAEGPYFDSAASSAAIYARGQPGIEELIAKIKDPKLREAAEKQVKVPQTDPNTR